MSAAAAEAAILAPEPPGPVEPASPPTISIVVPAYEAAKTVAEAVASALEQDPPPHEVIVADDGSRDEIADALARFADRITLLREPHRGVAAARNAGWRAASGDFVLYADADDVVLPGKIAALRRLGRERPDLDLLATDMFFERDDQPAGRFGEVNAFPLADQRTEVLRRCFVVQPAFRRSRLREVGGFDEELHSAVDWDCILRLVLSGSTAGLYDAPLAVYRIHDNSLASARVQSLGDRVRLLEKASRSSDLRPDERPALEASLALQRERTQLAEAQAAVTTAERGARGRCLRLALTRGNSARVRAWGLGIALLPGRLSWWTRRGFAEPSQLSRNLPVGPRSEQTRY
ncbi:MAG TPA: glycosyltransferase [Solirubrobacterales bacterium]|nr:glycosyltransferase [Solirubrobacterales bacterium]